MTVLNFLLRDLPDELQHTAYAARLAEIPTERIPDPAPPPPGSNEIPYRPNPFFVGREEEMAQLAAAFKGGGKARAAIGQAAAATGMGGIGKTQLAAAFAHRYGQYFLGGVFWFNFAEAETILSQVAASGGSAGLNLTPNWDELPQEAQVAQVRAAWREELPRLLIFDNCEERALLEDWLPKTGACRVLVTSRQGKWPRALGLTPVRIQTLSRPESLELLAKFRPDLGVDNPELDAVAEELGDLPLALHIAGSYLEKYQYLPVGEYLESLRQPDLLDRVLQVEDGYSPTRHGQHVGRTFALSLARLDPEIGEGQMARALLARAACLAPGVPVPRRILHESLGEDIEPKQAEDAVLALLAVGLVEEGESGEILVHRLVASFAAGVLDDLDAWMDAVQAVTWAANRVNNAGFPGEMLPVLPHLQHMVRQVGGQEHERIGALYNTYGFYLQSVGDYAGARPYYEQALAIFEKRLGPEHPNTKIVRGNLQALLEEIRKRGG